MRFGMPTLLETRTLEDSVGLCRELGLKFVELNMNLPQYQIREMDARSLLRLSESSGIDYTVHLDENLNVCDFNPRVADAWLQTALDTIAFADKLGIPVINMHLSNGVYFTLPHGRKYLFDEYIGAYLERLTFFRDECERMIAGSSIRICIENTDGWDHEFSQKGLTLLLESGVFGLTFDIGHNWSIGGRDEALILSLEDKLCHMHFHDAVGGKNHMALGTGEMELTGYFRLAQKHDCSVVLETKTIEGLRQSAAWVDALTR